MNGYAKHSGGEKPQFDVVIIGAGISGINTAYRVQSNFPNFSYCILEARDAIGGTWDLFKYPGIRSDSDLFTFGLEWYPWKKRNAIASGGSIAQYVREGAAKFGIDKNIRFRHRVTSTSWSSKSQQWKLQVQKNELDAAPITARFVVFSTGYYDYENPLDAKIPGLDSFDGQTIHPQFWPEDLDYTDKKAVIIGSGATAITLLPNMIDKAKKVTMLQRSPSYVFSLPNQNPSTWIEYFIPQAILLRLRRMQYIIGARLLFLFCTTFPNFSRWILRMGTKRRLPKGMSLDPNFNPRYFPWEQRLCVSPDGDFFRALHNERAEIVTDTIRTVTPTGLELDSGKTLDADIIITATGLRLSIGGKASIYVDGVKVNLADKYLWRGSMLQDMPNAAFVIGYTNASWTLGADATATMIIRVLRNLQDKRCASVVPRVQNPEKLTESVTMNLKSTYVQNAKDIIPKTASSGPWTPRKDYLGDQLKARYGSLQGLEWTS